MKKISTSKNPDKTTKNNPVELFTARITLPAGLSEADVVNLDEAMMLGAVSHSVFRRQNMDGGPWILQWMLAEKPDAADLQARLLLASALYDLKLDFSIGVSSWSIEDVPVIDWLAHSYQQFPAFSVGEFFIYGSHFEGKKPDAQISLQIDAATAFGSGEHGTTSGCLRAMLDLKDIGQCPWNVLDMGTGSGILAIAAFKLWKTPVLAVDNDAEATRVAAHHRDVNTVPEGMGGMICETGDGFATKIVQQKKPFDLIIANILAGPLKDMASDLKAVTDENGFIILSGILNTQADEVLDVYTGLGLTLKKHYEIGEWSTLVLQNAA